MATMDIAKNNNLYGSDISEIALSLKQPQCIDYVDSDGKLVVNYPPTKVSGIVTPR